MTEVGLANRFTEFHISKAHCDWLEQVSASAFGDGGMATAYANASGAPLPGYDLHNAVGGLCGPRWRQRQQAVYEVVAGQPTWGCLFKTAVENVADLATRSIMRAIKTHGRTGCAAALTQLRDHLMAELPASLLKEVLNVCVARDRFRCHHNPTDCLALEIWRVFYSEKHADVNIVHHEFAFPKTCNYPEILSNVDHVLRLMSESGENTTTTSFKMELKQCETGFYLEDMVVGCVMRFTQLRVLEVPGLASDKLLNVIALYCTKLEVLNLPGCRDLVSDAGFARFVETARCRPHLGRLDVSRCALSQQSLVPLQRMKALRELKVSTTLLDDINWNCDGHAVLLQSETGETLGLDCLALPSVSTVGIPTRIISIHSCNCQAYRQYFPDYFRF